jgi:hypothetical protein
MDLQAGAQAAAAVLAHVLGVEGDPAELADKLALLSDEPPVAAWAVELAADGDGVAFLLYAYDLAATDADGATARERLDRDLAVIAEATARGAPGPRLVAQADVGDWAIVVATSPATLERLAADPDARPATPQELVEFSGKPATARERARAANALLAALRNADQRSLAFLRAVGSGEADPTPEERALALFIADGRSLAHLPRALARAVERAAAQADGSPT